MNSMHWCAEYDHVESNKLVVPVSSKKFLKKVLQTTSSNVFETEHPPAFPAVLLQEWHEHVPVVSRPLLAAGGQANKPLRISGIWLT